MTPKEKAIKLCQKYQRLLYIDTTAVNPDYIHPDSQKCALIAVDEILSAHFMKKDSGYKTFWLNVQQEIQKL
jgi:hypothetical protein